MKLTFGKRIVMFFHWLFSLLICTALVVYTLAPDFAKAVCANLEDCLGNLGLKVAGAVLLALYLGLAVHQLLLILNRKKRVEKGFITVDSAETGRVRIAVSAIEQMVRQSVRNIDGIHEMKISIDSDDDAIVIGVDASIISGSHVPTITMNMQRSIRQFVEVNCGVAVRSVSISINAVSNQAEPSRRGFLGRVKPQPKAAPIQESSVYPEAEKTETSVEANEPETDESPVNGTSEPASYDFDKPYESDFAKDLAEMRAREAADAANGHGEQEAFDPLDERR